MLEITIPMWVLLAVAGLPTMILLMLSVRLMRMKRYKNKSKAQQVPDAFQGYNDGFGKQMNQIILEQQIDSVFTALITIIETEQIKLKALLCRNPSELAPAGCRAVMPKSEHRDDRYEETVTTVKPPKEGRQSVAEMVAEGSTPEEIARRLGLSHSELALAMKIHGSRRGDRLEAVA